MRATNPKSKEFSGLNAGANGTAFMPQLQQCCNESNSGIGYGSVSNSVEVTDATKAVKSFKMKKRNIKVGTVGSGTDFNNLMFKHGFSKQSSSKEGGGEKSPPPPSIHDMAVDWTCVCGKLNSGKKKRCKECNKVCVVLYSNV